MTAGLQVGDEVEVVVGPVAHGGHFVARIPTAEGERPVVVFVRHALTGERVVVRITEDAGRFLRGDAVEVLEPSPDRVPAPCPLAHPGGCGGCDFQHVDVAAQRRLKTTVVREQLQRLAGIDSDVEVEAVPGDEHGLRWRTRMQFVGLPGGRVGLRQHRSHAVVEVDDCLIAAPDARVEIASGRRTANRPTASAGVTVTETVLGRDFDVAEDGFWQVHRGAPTVLVETVLGMLAARPGERVLDLYAGVGLFSAFLADAVGPEGSVVAVEGDRRATAYAERNLDATGWARAVAGRVERVLAGGVGAADLVVLDPPRAGAKREVVEALAALGPRAIAYVACDPAALARDLGYFAGAGYRLADLRAFDLFPMTHHVECVALVVPA
jgi:tRNA/tmRNA/rRNA uracil-C5-methylase (TrmA/RlmC/RlmD family)